MSWSVGDRVHLVEGGVSVFEIVELEPGGDPARVKVQPVDPAPGAYPFSTPVKYLVPAS
ncbi:hypothetical protein [Nocardia cyriacigeorgica]|uniref:hypothetical protein n=1 Tax=Nocardia cyriacigeorgica TaxID=135487 RepID=UPI001895A609|nr:hypothetical protein [Nocardia cyriacigeorgica]MBF6416971.1 hypothetical protein [Nocardia cyriacigeorgica]